MEEMLNISQPAVTIKCWVDLYSDKLYTWAFHKTASKELAEDLVQDTFLAAFQSITNFEHKSKPETWLFSILNNKIAAHFRKLYRNPAVTESESSPDAFFDNFFDEDGGWRKEQRPAEWSDAGMNLLDDAAFVNTLQNCLERLPQSWMAAMQLKYLEEKKGDVICQELGITPTNFWQVLHRAKLQLRKCLENHWFKK